MKVIVQRAEKAKVIVNKKVVGQIDKGLMLLVGFTEGDDIDKVKYLTKKIVNLRIFPDNDGIMNKSLLDIKGSILSVSQFTLYADTHKGNRPSYKNALNGIESKKLYDVFNKELKEYTKVETGIFGADMDVEFVNIGPTTIIMER